MRWVFLLPVLPTLLLSGPATADVVFLRDGAHVDGRVVHEGAEVVVALDGGTVTFSADEVERIEREPSPLHAFDTQYRRLGASDVAGRKRLARWASARGLVGAARGLYREVLVLTPDDADARRALGYRRAQGRWMTEPEYMRTLGRVRYAGRWVTKDEAEAEREAQAERVEARRAWQLAREARRFETEEVVPLQGSIPDPQWWPAVILPEGYAPFYGGLSGFTQTVPVFPAAPVPR